MMPDSTLELQMRVRRLSDLLETEIDDQSVMMDIEQGSVSRIGRRHCDGFHEVGSKPNDGDYL